jgi:hypothetical protein
MDHAKCRTCGERHRRGPFPKFQSSRGGVHVDGGRKPALGPGVPLPLKAGTSAGVAPGPREATPKRGRPRIGEPHEPHEPHRPWVAAGMSERTWYRRKAEERVGR